MDNTLKKIKKAIEARAFVSADKVSIISPGGGESSWLFDLRKIILSSNILNSVTEIFWDKLSKYGSYQVGGVESAAIPLIAALLMRAESKQKPLNGFYLRKSRKKTGLANIIEGMVDDSPVVLVDDLINSGSSLIRQVEILSEAGKKVVAICVILRFRNEEYYSYFKERGIDIISLFSLEDFKGSLNILPIIAGGKIPVPRPFSVLWRMQSPNPNYFYVIPKSAPTIDESKIFFGSDSGNFWAISQENGKEAWRFKILGFGSKGKMIFSSPAIHEDLVYFGAYDGNFYALDKNSGEKTWVFMEADWIGSSPVVAHDLNLIFVGLEFGLLGKRGGIVALDTKSGEKKWEYFFPGLTHGSPSYSKNLGIVVIGSNDGGVYCFKGESGKLIWKIRTGGEIKASFSFDEARGLIVFGSFDQNFYIASAQSGEIVYKYQTGAMIYSTPSIWKNFAIVTSLDKKVYCFDIDKMSKVWEFQTAGRIFASPEIIDNKIYVGSNDGCLYELDPKTGKNTAIFQATERITNKIAYNPKTKRCFVSTFANEIYCLERKNGQIT